eukprot:5936932-Amphidinium_carterae.1
MQEVSSNMTQLISSEGARHCKPSRLPLRDLQGHGDGRSCLGILSRSGLKGRVAQEDMHHLPDVCQDWHPQGGVLGVGGILAQLEPRIQDLLTPVVKVEDDGEDTHTHIHTRTRTHLHRDARTKGPTSPCVHSS